MLAKYDFENKCFYFVSTYEEKDILKSNGFYWDPTKKRWYTKDHTKIINFIQNNVGLNVDNSVYEEINRWYERRKENMELNLDLKIESDFNIPLPENLNLYPFQKIAVKFITKNKNVLIADEMGLGKTVEVLAYINTDENIKNVLIVCPASLKLNWEREAKRWLVRHFDISIFDGDNSKIADFVIVNYEMLVKYLPLFKTKVWDLLILDESQYIKNFKAKRTKAIIGFKDNGKMVKGLKDYAKQKILLTGTPILNYPHELYTQLKVLNHPLAQSYKKFREEYIVYDPQFNTPIGGKNIEELQRELRSSCMLRREKKDVLKELPAKIRQVLLLPETILSKEELEENKRGIELIKTYWDENLNQLHSSSIIPFEEISSIRHKTVLKKLPYVFEIIENALESEDKIVVFAHHHDVINNIYEKFKDIAVKATGEENTAERDRAVYEFQNNPNIRIFIGSIQAMGLGITLTASSLAIFVEIEWRPADLVQAEDRLHRIGQENVVHIQYVLVNDSIEAFMMEKISVKMEISKRLLDSNYINSYS